METTAEIIPFAGAKERLQRRRKEERWAREQDAQRLQAIRFFQEKQAALLNTPTLYAWERADLALDAVLELLATDETESMIEHDAGANLLARAEAAVRRREAADRDRERK